MPPTTTLVVALCASLVGVSTAAKGSGTAHSPSTGRCEAYNSSGVCGTFIDYPVFFWDFQIQSEVEAIAITDIAASQVWGTETCKASLPPLTCAQYFRRCSEIDGEAIPHLPCQSMCKEAWDGPNGDDGCRSIFKMGLMVSKDTVEIPFCGGEQYSDCIAPVDGKCDPTNDRFGTKVGARVWHYPTPYEGQTAWPEVSSTWSNGEEIQCNSPAFTMSMEDMLDEFSGPREECPHPLLDVCANSTGPGCNTRKCQLPCPHPMYEESEYDSMKAVYVALGALGAILACILLADAAASTLAANKIKGKSNPNKLVLYQAIGAGFIVVYFALGPLLVGSMTPTDLVCKGMAHLDDFETAPLPDTTACGANRSSVYFVMIVFNCIGAACTDLLYKLMHVTDMAKDAARDKREALTLRFWTATGLLLPLILMSIMYSANELDPADSLYLANFGRYAWLCGPRLSAQTELLLVHLPLILSGVFVAVQSLRTLHYVVKAAKTLSAVANNKHDSEKKKKKNGKKSATEILVVLAMKVASLGLAATCFVVLYLVATAVLLPLLDSTGTTVMDWMNCKITAGGVYSTISVASCDAFADTHDLHTFDGRPPVALMTLSYATQPLVCLLFGVFFCIMRKDDILVMFGCGANSSSKKKVQPANSSAAGSSAASSVASGVSSTSVSSTSGGASSTARSSSMTMGSSVNSVATSSVASASSAGSSS